MRLPRRVPWSSFEELDTICTWIYADENDLESKIRAINRLSAWKVITPLPHALESTLSLLVVIVQDQKTHSHLSLRQSYATAIIRLVNGLVDPLQHGAYARSIASIASQLGLPPWLVELRHAATHEDLPSIELLRQAAREIMSWLLHNYFLPTINPSSVVETRERALRPVMPALKRYKNLLKITTRDVSLKTQNKDGIALVLKDIERWITEAKIATNVAIGEIGWETYSPGNSLNYGEMDVKEKWALEQLCDSLLQKGVLVPLSKRKRVFPTSSFSPPRFSLLLWSPLLKHLQSLHPGFLGILVGRIISHLLADTESRERSLSVPVDLTYDLCLARWAAWCIDICEGGESQSDFNLKKEVTINLMHAMGDSILTGPENRKGAITLLESLCSGNSQLEAILPMFFQSPLPAQPNKWNPADVAVMGERLNSFISLDDYTGSPTVHPKKTKENQATTQQEPIVGWRLLKENTGWRSCPVGVHCSSNGLERP